MPSLVCIQKFPRFPSNKKSITLLLFHKSYLQRIIRNAVQRKMILPSWNDYDGRINSYLQRKTKKLKNANYFITICIYGKQKINVYGNSMFLAMMKSLFSTYLMPGLHIAHVQPLISCFGHNCRQKHAEDIWKRTVVWVVLAPWRLTPTGMRVSSLERNLWETVASLYCFCIADWFFPLRRTFWKTTATRHAP